MIFDFRDVQFDEYDNVERPSIFLKTMAGEIIAPIGNYYNLKGTFRYVDISEISFEISDKYEDNGELKLNPYFDLITGMRIVELDPYGEFILVNPELQDDGTKRTKQCTAYSLEYEFNFKTMPALEGTFLFYDKTNIESNDTMMDYILEAMPNWGLGHVDGNVAARYRTFDNSSDNIYPFMMNTLQESYSCIFLFDTKNKLINVYDANMDAENIPVFLSHENFIKNVEITELSDEIVTCLRVYGADDISIRSVNPLNSEKIYNIDYFIENGDIPSDVAQKWIKWRDNYEIYQELFSNLYSELYVTLMEYNTENTQLTELKNELSTYETELDAYLTDSGDHSEEIVICNNNIDRVKKEIEIQQTVVENCFDKCNKIQTLDSDGNISSTPDENCLMSSLVKLCAFENYLNTSDLKILNQFFREASLQDSTFVVTDVAVQPDAFRQIKDNEVFKIEITEGNLYKADDYTNLTDQEIADLELSDESKDMLEDITNTVESYMNQDFYTIQQGKLSVYGDEFELSGTVINSTISFSSQLNENELYDVTVTLTINNPEYNGDSSYSTGTLTIMGETLNKPSSDNSFSYRSDTNDTNTGFLKFEVNSGLIALSYENSIFQTQLTLKELFDFGVDSLKKLAYPSYQFSVDSANFLFVQMFEPIRNQIALGGTINVELTKNIYKQPILTEIVIDFENWNTFQLTFSDKYRSGDSAFMLADIIGQTAKTAASLDASKFTYAAFKNSSVENDVEEYIGSALDLAKKHIIDSKNQVVTIDDKGIHLRKLKANSTTEFDLCEIRMRENRIVFTDDGWKTASMAMGVINIEDPDDPTKMINTIGVVAESLVGNVLIGNKLTIESTTVDPITGISDLMQFKVDASGAFIGNGVMAMQGANEGGKLGNKILLDPKYGLVMGDSSIFSTSNGKIAAGFLDDNGDYKTDAQGYPEGINFLLDITSGSALFRGTILATEGYFAGTVSANTIVQRSENEELAENSLGAELNKIFNMADNGEFDSYNAIILSSNGTVFKKTSDEDEITTTLTVELYRGGQEVDSSGDEFEYRWTKYDQYGQPVNTFSGTGKKIDIVDDSKYSKMTFSCEVLKIKDNDEKTTVTQAQITLITIADGATGNDGKSSYIHIMYSPNADGSGMQTEPSVYVGIFVSADPQPSVNYKDYTWSQLKGDSGLDGNDGQDGQSQYVHLAYADLVQYQKTQDGSIIVTEVEGFSADQSISKAYFGQYVDNYPVASTDPYDYQWAKIQGEQGTPGEGIKLTSVKLYYYCSSSAIELNDGKWTDEIPEQYDKFIWSKSVSTTTDNQRFESEPRCITPELYYYDESNNKITVSSIWGEYGITTSPTSTPTKWELNEPDLASIYDENEINYMWCRNIIAYSDSKDEIKNLHLASSINSSNIIATNAFLKADTKTKIFYQDTEPNSSQGLSEGDIWFSPSTITNDDGTIRTTGYIMHNWTGAIWEKVQLGLDSIGDDVICGTNIGENAISTKHIAANSVTTNEIATGAITANEIATGTIVAGNIQAGTITGDKIAANTITADHIAAKTLTTNMIYVGDDDDTLSTLLSEYNEQYDELNEKYSNYILNEQQYLRFDSVNGLRIGSALTAENGFFVQLTNNRLSFYGAGREWAYISTDKDTASSDFYIHQATIKNELRIGNFVLTSDENNYLNIECIS